MKMFAIRWAKLAAAGALAVMMTAGAAGAADITVCKATSAEDKCMYTTIQEAVNAAKYGNVIEIMDTEIYAEQVTIDGRGAWDAPSVWDGKNQGPIKRVMGGKNGITIRYAPTGARMFGNHDRPTIKWKDTENTSPKNQAESKVEGQMQGQSGNFETNGALRILWAQGVTIDGIKVDGGGMAPFENKAVWDGRYPLFHGNAAITLAVAGGTVIRNCDITNGYFGINVKDRNTGGVFGNPNPADNDKTIPLSGFGKVGNHLFEYNKIHNNFTGMFFESSWDLGSSIRYNLIYSNIHTTSALPALEDPSNAVGGAILFKDVKYTPVAIYNNTFWNNTGNIMGGWKVGAPHLLFNNIFGKPSYTPGAAGMPPNSVGNAMFEHRFPYRMHNTLFAATAEMKSETRYINGCSRPGNWNVTPPIEQISGQQIFGITQVRISNNIPDPASGATTVNCIGELEGNTATTTEFKAPGGLITGTLFAATANIRWLETTKSINGTENLFVSVDPNSADFLRPIWDHTHVKSFIKGQGWKDIGMKNSDGTDADIGAISPTGRALGTVARIKPSNVVLVSGSGNNTKAKASFYVNVDGGSMNNAKIGFLRWIAPLPTNPPEPSGNAAPPVPTGSIAKLTNPAGTVTLNGNYTTEFGIPALPGLGAADSAGQYGFFEVVVSGKDASGNDVASDIGFLPYRKLEYTLQIKVLDASGKETATVVAGQPYTLSVKPCKGSDPANCGTYGDGALTEISYELQSNAAAFMYSDAATTKPFIQDGPSPSANMTSSGKTYTVYFTRAGGETIMGSGIAPVGNGGRLVFLGTADITVKPGAPDHLIFTDPIPVSQLGNASAPQINRGVDREVKVEVQDYWGNAVDQPVNVTIAITAGASVGDAGAPGNINNKSVSTGTTGVAVFAARVTGGTVGQTFDMTATASISNGHQKQNDNVGRLRVGRTLDRFEVFYSDAGSSKYWKDDYDENAKIDGNVGDWFKVTVKVVVGDSVNNASAGKFVLVGTADKLTFSATEGGAPAEVFPLSGGVATFWVTGTDNVSEGSITVDALSSNDPTSVDASIRQGSRGNIYFKKPTSSIHYAAVYGDGHGRPDSVRIYYQAGSPSLLTAGAAPSEVKLKWSGVNLTASSVTARSELVLHAAFTGDRPTGRTSVVGKDILEVIGGSGGATAVETPSDVRDSIGPVLANGDPNDGAGGGGATILDNAGGTNADTLTFTLSEQLDDPDKLKSLLYTSAADPGEPAGASTGIQLTVLAYETKDNRTFKAAVSHTPDGPAPNGWIRLNPSGNAVTDGNGNRPHDRNRWVRLKVREQAPIVSGAYYTADVTTGKPDYIYVTFSNKDAIDLDWWFMGGSVKIEENKAVAAPNPEKVKELFDNVDGMLRINLNAAASFDAVRTSGDMKFTLEFNPSLANDETTPWVKQNLIAKDKAKPVIVKAVLLTGSPKGDVNCMVDCFNDDTLMIYYSEPLNLSSKKLSPSPVTMQAKDGLRFGSNFEPALLELVGGDLVYDKGFYRASYRVKFDEDKYPSPGDLVHINENAGIGDDADDNVQDRPDNRWVELEMARRSNWIVTVKRNPFISGGSDERNKVVVELSPNAKGVQEVEVLKATIRIVDNVGALVLDTTIDRNFADPNVRTVTWEWKGANSKGRFVGTGTYLFKATCEFKAKGDDKADVYKMAPKMLGVVRGKS